MSLVNEPHKDYYAELWHAVRNHGNEIRKWLLEVEITDEFASTREAPETKDREIMFKRQQENVSYLTEAKTVIMNRKVGDLYDDKVVSVNDLFGIIIRDYMYDQKISGFVKGKVLDLLGYTYSDEVWFDNKNRTVRTKKSMKNKELHAYMSTM